MKVWILEDNPERGSQLRNSLVAALGISGQSEELSKHVEIMLTLEGAKARLPEFVDEDVVLLDSQVPRKTASLPEPRTGEEFARRIRAAGRLCRLIWHSDHPLAEDVAVDAGIECRLGGPIAKQVLARHVVRERSRLAKENNWQEKANIWLVRLGSNPEAVLALDVLCQGYLAVEGLRRADSENRVYESLLATGEAGKLLLERAANQSEAVREVATWFRLGIDAIDQTISASFSGHAIDFWNQLAAGRPDAQEDVAKITRLYDQLKKVGDEPRDDETWYRLITDAHNGVCGLFTRGCL